MIRISVQRADFDIGVETARLNDIGAGAIASFTGIVRKDGGITQMTLEHYPGMTERALEGLANQAQTRWPLDAITIIHRVGPLNPGDQIVLVLAASAHRAAALEGCAFLIDKLKTEAPFWKKERRADGTENWVEAREADYVVAQSWNAPR